MKHLLIVGLLMFAVFATTSLAQAQAATVQQTVVSWDAYVDPAPTPPLTVLPASLALAGYQINWGQGQTCLTFGTNLTAGLIAIPKAVAPGVTPTSYVHVNYLDTASLNCYEVYVKFADGTFSQRSKRLFKEIISTKPVVANPLVQ